jgi:hypothetical protein
MLRAEAEEAKARGSDFAVDPRAFGAVRARGSSTVLLCTCRTALSSP